MTKLKLSKIFFFLDGYLKSTYSNVMLPLSIDKPAFKGGARESIWDFSSMIWNTLPADFSALLFDGIYETETPAPIAPTNMI